MAESTIYLCFKDYLRDNLQNHNKILAPKRTMIFSLQK